VTAVHSGERGERACGVFIGGLRLVADLVLGGVDKSGVVAVAYGALLGGNKGCRRLVQRRGGDLLPRGGVLTVARTWPRRTRPVRECRQQLGRVDEYFHACGGVVEEGARGGWGSVRGGGLEEGGGGTACLARREVRRVDRGGLGEGAEVGRDGVRGAV